MGVSRRPPEGIAQVALAESIGMSAGQISQLVDRLGAVKLIESTRSASDRRRRLWRVTDAGRDTLFEAGCRLAIRVEELDRRLSHVELGTLKDFLERLSAETRGPVLPHPNGSRSHDRRSPKSHGWFWLVC